MGGHQATRPSEDVDLKEPVAQWRCRLPQAWWLEKRPWRRWVAAGMSQRCGEVGVAGQAQRADGEVAQAGHHAGNAAGARVGSVFAEGRVADPVQPVLDLPVPAKPAGQLRGLAVPRARLVTAYTVTVRQRLPSARTRRMTWIAWAAWGKHKPATAATFRVRSSMRPWPWSRVRSMTGICRHGSPASWACRVGWLALTTSR